MRLEEMDSSTGSQQWEMKRQRDSNEEGGDAAECGLTAWSAKRGDISGARHWLDQMRKEGVKSNIFTFSAIISGAEQSNWRSGVG